MIKFYPGSKWTKTCRTRIKFGKTWIKFIKMYIRGVTVSTKLNGTRIENSGLNCTAKGLLVMEQGPNITRGPVVRRHVHQENLTLVGPRWDLCQVSRDKASRKLQNIDVQMWARTRTAEPENLAHAVPYLVYQSPQIVLAIPGGMRQALMDPSTSVKPLRNSQTILCNVELSGIH